MPHHSLSATQTGWFPEMKHKKESLTYLVICVRPEKIICFSLKSQGKAEISICRSTGVNCIRSSTNILPNASSESLATGQREATQS